MSVRNVRRQVGAVIVAVVGLQFAALPAQAQLVAFKTGEQTSGMNKLCFYDALGSTHTKTVSAVSLCPLSIRVQAAPSYSSPAPARSSGGGVAFLSGEQVTGMTKQCFYDYLGSAVAKTVSSVSLCPLTISPRN